MTIYYHSPIAVNAEITKLAIGQPVKDLDFALYRLASGQLDFIAQDVKPDAPAIGYRKVYVRNRDLTLQDSDGIEYITYTSEKYVQIVDQKVSTNGGTFTSGAWRTRDLNTFLYGDLTFASLDSNQVTLESGTYRIEASAPAYRVDGHVIRWYNVTDAVEVTAGSMEFTNTTMSRSYMGGQFTITDSKVFELQHRCQSTYAVNNAMGQGSNWATAIFSIVELWKL